MRKIAIVLALASTALASPALARDDQWYVGVDGGVMLLEDMKLDVTTTRNAVPTTVNDGITIDNKYGYDVGGVIGYDFGGFRLESEVSYRRAHRIHNDALNASPSGVPTPNNLGLLTGVRGARGHASALSFMVNGLLDFGSDDGLQGFVGGGAGVARVNVNNTTHGDPAPWLNDSDTGFAWQALAGIRAPISDHWDIGLKYRFFNAPNVDLVDRIGRNLETRFRSHSLMASLVYNFGGEPVPVPVAPMAPEAPPPPPPPPPAQVVCNTGPYIVFFDFDKSDLRPDATSVLDNAVTQYGNCGSANVMVAGYADRSGSSKYNVGLSGRRNTAVRGYLESKGIASGSISTQANGESNPRVQTADGVREPQNRRVEVSYGPGSGN